MRRSIDIRIVGEPLRSGEIALPSYATDGAAGMDLRACIAAAATLQPGERRLFPTGIAIDIRDPGLALKYGVRVAQGLGVIDADYHGEIGVILINDGDAAYTVQVGERIAQLIFMPVTQVELHVVDDFRAGTERGAGGFGHTGTA
ncbi:MAG TPA: dUTP diphosphatase [Rhodocyclaceae bacterium]|nr:dUTP diphosphatase [Rhodocyclaceae bacterium]